MSAGRLWCYFCLGLLKGGLPRPVDPNDFGQYDRPVSVVSSTGGVESSWRRRQTIKRGVTRRVKLTQGNFITEYQVPGPVYSAIESKWTGGTRTTEFSYVYASVFFWLFLRSIF